MRQSRRPARVHRFTYAIRNIVAEAQKVEAAGTRVRYLNIGDPVAFGFKTPAHLVAAVERAMRDGHNNYWTVGRHSGGARSGGRRVHGERVSGRRPDRVFITAGTSEGIELTLERRRRQRRRSARADADLPALHAPCSRSSTPKRSYYRLDSTHGWMPDLDHLKSLVTPATRALVVIDPNNPTGAVYPTETRRALLDFADRHGLPDPRRRGLRRSRFRRPRSTPYGLLDPDAPIISFSSLSKAYLAPGWRTGWMACGRSPRLDDVVAAVQKLADGRLCSTVPMQYAIAPALTGDRSHQLVVPRGAEGARRSHGRAPVRDARRQLRRADRGVLRDAATIALPPGRTDEDYVKALLHATGVLCVYGSGFGLPAEEGFLRIVFLAPLDELSEIYDLMAAFTAQYSAEISDFGVQISD